MVASHGWSRAGVWVLALIGMAGCGGGSGGPPQAKKYPVEGTVTLDKKPLEKGTVYFKTVATGQTESIDVVNGTFKGEAGEGDRRVEVASYVTKEVGTGAMKGEVKENLIPARYNVDSTLKATVTAAGPNKFTFDITSR